MSSQEERLKKGGFEVSVIERGPGGEPIGNSHSFRDGRSVTATPDEGRIKFAVQGLPLRNEANVAEVARELVHHFKIVDEPWTDYEDTTDRGDGVDLILIPTDGHDTLPVQVTRAISDSSHHARLAKHGKLENRVRPAEVAEALRETIQKKALSDHSGVALVLDATDTPQCVVSQVVEEFRRRHQQWAADLGFRAIWLVGRANALVFRLDTTIDALEPHEASKA